MIGAPIPVTIEADMEQILEFVVDCERPEACPTGVPWLHPDWVINGQKGFTMVLLSMVWLIDTNRIIIVRNHANDNLTACSKANPVRITFVAAKLELGEDEQTKFVFFPTGLVSPLITNEDNLYDYDKTIAAELLQLVMADDLAKHRSL